MIKRIKQLLKSGSGSFNFQAARDINIFTTKFPTELVDQKAKEEIDNLRKSRFFGDFDRINSSVKIGKKLSEGIFCGATDSIRCCGLAWCARILSYSEKVDIAVKYLNLARDLDDCSEIDIANAFITSQNGDKSAALSILAAMGIPSARTAALMIVTHHEGAKGMYDWIAETKLKITALDSDGKCFIMMQLLTLNYWENAEEIIETLNDQDLVNVPVLHHLMAITHLLSAVPVELRSVVLKQLPFDAASFPLASDTVAMNARRIAQEHFVKAAIAARQLNCKESAMLYDDYVLWLKLRDPLTATKGKVELEDKLRNPSSALRLIPIALQFGLKLDLDAVEREIDRQIALHGGLTQNTAVAQFGILIANGSPKDIADYIEKHLNELSRFLDEKSMKFTQIEMLSKAGLTEKANKYFEHLLADGLSKDDESRLRTIIAEAKGEDPVENRKTLFNQTDSLDDLAALIAVLQASERWEELCEFGETMFERTRSWQDAELLAKALTNEQKTKRLVKFLETKTDLRQKSRFLQMSYCWALYNEGRLIQARTELAELSDRPDNANYRRLYVKLRIALGDWTSLTAFVVDEYQAKDRRSAEELIQLAQLAYYLNSPHAKELTLSATAKTDKDAGVLITAFFLAITAGWENDNIVGQWLTKAAELSDDKGPVQMMTIKDVAARIPDWNRRESEIWHMLMHGEIPMFIAEQSLNRSLIDQTLFPAMTNLAELDPRRKKNIPSYSGKRAPIAFNISGTTIGLDITTLVTLSFLGILDKTLDAFEAVYVPHSTMGWLFEEKRKASFHQPSRIKNAHHIQNLLSNDLLKPLIPSTVPDSDLSAQVGDELAAFIAEAQKPREDDDRQHIVVRPAPVHRIGSLMDEEADLREYGSVISSCIAVVNKLQQKGRLTIDEYNRANAYLQLHEKSWPLQPEITDGASLYLDELAVTYFLHLGILEKLKAAGFTALISPGKVSEFNNLISYESIANKVCESIERIRHTISSAIESRKIKIDRQQKFGNSENLTLSGHTTVGTLALARLCDCILVDDRFINQHTKTDTSAQIFSTLDLLDALVQVGSISPEENWKYRTQLRRAGHILIPVQEDELSKYLRDSSVDKNKVIEIAELKAIRENLLSVRMRNWLQLPTEIYWLDSTLKTFIHVLHNMWKSEFDNSILKAYSSWIVEQIDILGWAHCFGVEAGDNIVKTGRGVHILRLLYIPPDTPQNVKDAYWEWVEKTVLTPLKEQFPDIYSWIIDWYWNHISEVANTDIQDKLEGEMQ